MSSKANRNYTNIIHYLDNTLTNFESKNSWIKSNGLVFSVVLFTVSTSWLADSFPIHKLEDTNVFSWFVALFLTILSIALFNRYKNSLCSTTIISEQEFKPHKAVITLLSGTTTFTATDDQLLCPKSIEEAIKKSDDKDHISKHYWRQALRALSVNNLLQHLYVISSKQNTQFFNDYKKLIQYYRPEVHVHHITPSGIDFESLKDVNDAISKAIKHAKSDKYEMVDIAIDITGGQKTASVAAANFTLEHKDLEFFYVATGEELKVKTYNAISSKYEPPAS